LFEAFIVAVMKVVYGTAHVRVLVFSWALR